VVVLSVCAAGGVGVEVRSRAGPSAVLFFGALF